jgi:hypothetical protein
MNTEVNHCRLANVAPLKEVVSGTRSWTGFPGIQNQICRVVAPALTNPWEIINQAIEEHCRECWPYQEDCGAASECELYSFRTRRLRERVSADELGQTIRKECVKCLGSNQDICASPTCALHPYRRGGK